MPQMMPMYWILMLISMIIFMIMLSSFIYFFNPYSRYTLKNPSTFYVNFNHWNWKW